MKKEKKKQPSVVLVHVHAGSSLPKRFEKAFLGPDKSMATVKNCTLVCRTSAGPGHIRRMMNWGPYRGAYRLAGWLGPIQGKYGTTRRTHSGILAGSGAADDGLPDPVKRLGKAFKANDIRSWPFWHGVLNYK